MKLENVEAGKEYAGALEKAINDQIAMIAEHTTASPEEISKYLNRLFNLWDIFTGSVRIGLIEFKYVMPETDTDS